MVLAESLKEVVVSTYHIRLCTDIAYRVYSIKRRGVYYIFVIRARHFFEGGVYLKSNLFLANNSMLTDHFNFKKQKHVLVLVYKKSFFVLFSISQFAC